jgi:hypothetical protein
VLSALLQEAVITTDAEHTGANLLPCNAAARLQARANSHMSPLAEFDRRLQQVIHDFAVRILVPRWTAFDAVWETANRICDRYELGKSTAMRRVADPLNPVQLLLFMPEASASSQESSATDAPVQIHPPIAA